MAQLGLAGRISGDYTCAEGILLQPRKYAKSPGSLMLIPLLPGRPPVKELPAEIWIEILQYVFALYSPQSQAFLPGLRALRQSLLLVCKTLKDIALPLYYQHVQFASSVSLEKFTNLLHTADKQWDSIRRIPYSTPGRWVQVLDLADLRCSLRSDVCYTDDILARLFPLLPFLGHLILNDTFVLSSRVLHSLCQRDGNERLRSIQGVKLISAAVNYEDPFLQFLQHCPNLEVLEIFGSGIEPLVFDMPPSTAEPGLAGPSKGLYLPQLRKLSIIAMHCSPIMFALLHSELPCLSHLTLTPYDDTASSSTLFKDFIEMHGPKLFSLHLYAPKTWPTMLFASPDTLLHMCPQLHHLSLENPLPILTLPVCSTDSESESTHPLRILSIPRPSPEFLTVLETVLTKLPNLKIVRARDVRWLRAGMSSHAMEAGAQGELRRWRQRLARRGINVVDTAWSSQTA